ncbi:MAG: iron-containing alcohol dehydrogenase [Pseudomonadales bacterium]
MRIIEQLWHRVHIIFLRLASRFVSFPSQMSFVGKGSTEQLCAHIARLGNKNVFLVTDRPLVELGLAQRVVDALTAGNVNTIVFDGVLPDPTNAVVDAGLQLLQMHKCDAVLAMGGGSSIDSAKAIAAAATNGDVRQLMGYFKVKRAVLPLFAIPTTAGTGSEVSIGAVISDSTTHEKSLLVDPALMPLAVALDASLMTGMPPHITAATGMDALTHAVETYIGEWATEQVKAQSRTAVQLIFASLQRAYVNGNDIEARESMAIAAYYAGLALNVANVGNVHAIAHQLGGRYGTPHGLANAIVMPHVLDMTLEHANEGLAELADIAGVADGAASPRQKAEKFVTAVRDLNETLHIPHTLEALRADDIPTLARACSKEGSGYPAPYLMSRDDAAKILHTMLSPAS